MRNFLIKAIKYYLPTFALAGLIFYFSSVSSLRYETGNIPSEIFLRKAAHLVEYALLSFLVFLIFFRAHNFSLDRSVMYALFVSVAYSVSDEFHQSFVYGRSGQLIDVIFDAASVIFFLEIISAVKKFHWRKVLMIVLAFLAIIILELKMIGMAELYEEKAVVIENRTEPVQEENNSAIRESDAVAEDIIGAGSGQEKTIEPEKEMMPEKILIDVPFTSQAPFTNWDEYHEEACEEASLIMVKYYIDRKSLDKDTAEREIQDLIAYEMKKYGDYRDSNAKQIVEIARDHFGIKNLEVIYDFSPEDIKKYLAKGRPIIVPAAGRLLNNPNFTPPGPLYHNLVLVGYSGDTIITNDPGTRKGQGYTYDLKTLYNAIHDFPGDLKNIEKGQKAMIVFK